MNGESHTKDAKVMGSDRLEVRSNKCVRFAEMFQSVFTYYILPITYSFLRGFVPSCEKKMEKENESSCG